MRFGLVFSVLSAVACSESGVKKVNATPEAYITSHATGDTVDEGSTETVMGQVADADHALSELTTAWLYNGDPVCPDSAPDEAGAVSCDVTFTTDGGDITLTVRDPDGETASTRVTLDVQPTDAPSATIALPTADGVYYSDTLITLEATVADSEDAADALTVQWSSELAGDLDGDFNTPDSEGKLLGATLLDEGEHFITLNVTDSTGKAGSDSVVVTVGPPNSAPTCAITAPADGSAGAEGDDVRLEGTAADVDVASNLLTASWASDKDGPLGESTPDTDGSVGLAISDLTANTHRITLTVTDELGEPCATSIYYTVGTPPVLNVTAPADGVTLNHSDAVVFEATVTDNEDLPNEVALSWESDIDGVFSTDGADSAGAATVSIATLSAGDHVVTVTATDTDGLFVTDTVSFNLNAPPTVPTVTLEPDPAATNQMLVATASGSIDPEGTGTVTYTYAWFEDGTPSAESASATFPASATGKNHTYRVQVTASDGLVDSAFGYAEVNVINSDPVLSGPTLSAATAVIGDVLTCTASATDIDPEDSPTVTYAWSDGSTGPTYTVTLADAVDSAITCTATADDADGGVVTGTASATVTNTAPTVDTVTVTPAEASVGDELTCTATASDADGDTPTITYAWSDGSTGTTFTVPDTAVTGDVIICTATATDDRGVTGSATASATVTNSAPTVTAVTIGPDPAYNNDTLVCTATATDPDGDTPTIAYEWTGGATTRELPLTSIIAAPYDTFTCTATATDGELSSDPMSELVIIANRDPAVTATLTPASPTKLSTLTCTASDVSDPDDDATTVAFAWTINDAPAIAATTDEESILSDSIDRGDTVVCTVTVTDSSGGTATRTASATIGNTAPVVSDVTLSPSAVYTNDVITASATITDAEESADELDVTYRFFVGVDMVQEGSSNTLNGSVHFDKGDNVYVAVMADDGLVTHTESSDTITVLNTAPSAAGVAIEPAEPSVGEDDLRCAVTDATDPDGDALTYTIEWDVDGTPFTDTLTTDRPGDTVSADDTNGDEDWTCTVTPNDGEADGPAASASVTVEDCFQGWASSTSLADADYIFSTEAEGEPYVGESVASAGDVNGDGVPDLLIGSYQDPEGGDKAGKVYLFFGSRLSEARDIDLTEADYIFIGEEAGDNAGMGIAGAGDVDGDGLDDILIGARGFDGGAGYGAGKAYLILASSLADDRKIDLSDADYAFIGEVAGRTGRNVDSAGDVDGDGLADILIAAHHYSHGASYSYTGKVYLILGRSLGDEETIDLTTADYSFVGDSFEGAGQAIAGAGDIDGDGLSDIIIGAPGADDYAGKTYVVLAASLGTDATISLSEADYTFGGENPFDYSGLAVAFAGDTDGDGLSDVLIGAPYNDDNGTSAGKAYLVTAASLSGSSTIALGDSDYSFIGESSEDQAGNAVSGAGDVDGDGLSDVMIAAAPSDGSEISAGKTYLIAASSLSATHEENLATADFRFVGTAYEELTGWKVTSAGDINGDGLSDLLIGSYDAPGAAYLLLAPNACNTPPRGTEVSISPSSPRAGEDDLVCSIDTEAYDAEGDAITYTFEWTVDGDTFTDTDLTIHTGDTVPGSATAIGEEWTCTATPFDGTADGPAASATVTVQGCFAGWESSTSLADADYSFLGENYGDRAGYGVSSAGDVDGDGFDDLLVGAYQNDDGGDNAGKAYLVLASSLNAESTIELADASYTFIGESGSNEAGWAVAPAGDVDGDGLGDILVGSGLGWGEGKAYLVLGASLGTDTEIDLSNADYAFIGEAHQDYVGFALASAGDVDGDGLDDILVGARGNDDGARDAGKTYLIFGASLGADSAFNLAGADYAFIGEHLNDESGSAVASAGDVDGDGLDDILIGANENDDGAERAGKAYLILAASLGASSELALSAADYSFIGENWGNRAGKSLSSAGDVDGDELADILIGAPYFNDGSGGGTNGKGYIILGSSLGSDRVIPLTEADYHLVGKPEDYLGWSVSGGADVDGDGLADVILGADHNDDGGTNAGKAYVVRGSSLGSDSRIDLSLAEYGFVGQAGDHAGQGVASAGDVNGDGLSDLLIGATFSDAGISGAGAAHLVLATTRCNTPPRGTVLAITAFGEDSELICSIDTEAFDAEGDAITYTFEWTVDDEPFTDTDSTTHTGDTVDGTFTTEGEIWACSVTPDDGDLEGTVSEATHQIKDPISVQITTGADGACLLRDDGTVACWGTWPGGIVPSPDGSFIRLATGLWDRHMCGIKDDSTVECWGANDFGQASPPPGEFTALSLNSNTSCGLKTDGSLVCWGTYARALYESFISVTASWNGSCGIHEEDGLECHYDGGDPTSLSFWGAGGEVFGGLYYTCAINDSTGTNVSCWSENSGSDATEQSGTFDQIGVGYLQACGLLRSSGEIQCWEQETYTSAIPSTIWDFEEDRVRESRRPSFSPPSGRFTAIGVANHYGCGVRTDDEIVCWGTVPFGESVIPSL